MSVLVVHSSGMCWYLSGWLGDEVDGVAPAAIIVTSIKICELFNVINIVHKSVLADRKAIVGRGSACVYRDTRVNDII